MGDVGGFGGEYHMDWRTGDCEADGLGYVGEALRGDGFEFLLNGREFGGSGDSEWGAEENKEEEKQFLHNLYPSPGPLVRATLSRWERDLLPNLAKI